MGGSAFDDGWEHSWPPNEVRNVVLVGKTGNGKSSTGNSIIGKMAFKSKSSSAGVTRTSELQNIALEDGKILNVIDTPGLFDAVLEPEFVVKEIVKCIDMARDGIHALIVVLSVRSRVSREEVDCIQSLRKIFGVKITDYMIFVFTGGDDLQRDGVTLEDYLGCDCPATFEEILKMCENRCVLFDNFAIDEYKKSVQLKQLLFLVNEVVDKNGGKPFTNEFFVELKCGEMKLHDQTDEENSLVCCTKQDVKNEEPLKKITEMVEAKLSVVIDHLTQQLGDERAARLEAEATLKASLGKSIEENQEIRRLREDLERNRAETEQLRHKAESFHCSIM